MADETIFPCCVQVVKVHKNFFLCLLSMFSLHLKLQLDRQSFFISIFLAGIFFPLLLMYPYWPCEIFFLLLAAQFCLFIYLFLVNFFLPSTFPLAESSDLPYSDFSDSTSDSFLFYQIVMEKLFYEKNLGGKSLQSQ